MHLTPNPNSAPWHLRLARPNAVSHMLTWPSADSYRPKASEEERGEPQRFKFLCQDIGDTATQELTCQPILSRYYASMMQDGLQIG